MKKFYAIFLLFSFGFILTTNAQIDSSFSFSCTRDTSVTLCSSTCFTLNAIIPDIRASSNSYVVNSVTGQPGGCFREYVNDSIPGTATSLDADDQYSEAITLPFTFPFFGTDFTSLHLSGNGYLSFDPAIQEFDQSHYPIASTGGTLNQSGTPLDLPSDLYDRALIMGPYHDIDVAETTSPNERIKYDVVGIAPHRRWVASYFKIPLFSPFDADCDLLIDNTHQIVLYEGSGIVEVFLRSVQNCTQWNSGRAMVGMQNYNQDQAIMAPGRKASDPPWGQVNMNEIWRFVPAAGPTLYRSTQLFDLAGNLISTGDTTNLGNSTFSVAFPTVCPTDTTTYIVKTKYEQYNNPGVFFYSNDTIIVNAAVGVTLTATLDSVNAGCSNNGIGSITVNNVAGGTGPYEYSLDQVTWQPSNVFNLAPGTYTVYFREIGGQCISSQTKTILQDPNQVSGSVVPLNPDCIQATTGSITVTGVLGTPPYQYSINAGVTYQSSGLFSNLPAGTYTITIRDTTGCKKDTTITLTDPAALQATYVPQNATCSALGSVAISVTTPGNYEYSADGGLTWQPSPIIALAAGTYTILIRVQGTTCASPLIVTVAADPSVVSAVYSDINNLSCFGGADGTITVAGVSGTPGYQYQIDNLGYGNSGVFTGLAVGPHVVSVKDAAGCIKDTSIILFAPPALAATATPVDATCAAAGNGSISVSGSGGTPGYTYSIDGTTFGPGPFPVGAGTYTVTIKDLNGCTATATAPVTVGLNNDLTVKSIDDVSLCLGESVVLTTTTNYPGASFTWTGAGLNSTTIANPTATPPVAGLSTYDVIASVNGCTRTDQVQINTGAQLSVDLGPDQSIASGGQVQLNGTVAGATSYLWTSIPAAGGLNSTTIPNPIASPTETTIYTLTVNNAQGCSGSDDIKISVTSECINVRNSFSPNGDGNNDLWKVYDQFDCLKNVSVHIFNRYGSGVFESKDYRNTWNGNFAGKTLPDGTYYAVIQFTYATGRTQTVKTDLTIIR